MIALPPNPYKILNIDKLVDKSEIRKAYHKIVLKCHPDKVLDPSLKAQKQAEFQQVQKAYELLMNDAERSRYDDQVRLVELRKQVNAQKNSSPSTSAARAPTAKFEVFLGPKVESKTKSSPSAHKAASAAAAASPNIYNFNASARSCGDEIHHSREPRHHDQPHRSASYEKPSKWDEGRREERRRRKEEEERAKEAKDTIRREKKRLEKAREKERARQSTEEKNNRQKMPYVEPLPYAHESEAYFSKLDKKSSKSCKRADSSAVRNEAAAGAAAVPAIAESDRPAKTESTVSAALEHMKKCGGQLPSSTVPSLARAKTHHGGGEAAAFSSPPQAAPTPPPPPPPPERRESDAAVRLRADKTPSSHHKRHKDAPHSVPTLHKSTSSPLGGGLPLRPGPSPSPDTGYSRHMHATLGRSHTYHAAYADAADHDDMRRPSLDDYYLMQEGAGRERHRHRSSRRPRSPPPQQKYRIGKDLKATEVWSPSHGDSGPSSYFPKPLRHEDIVFGAPRYVHTVDSDADEDNVPFSHVKTSGHYQPHHVAPVHLSDVQYSKYDSNYDSADAHRPQPYTSVRA